MLWTKIKNGAISNNTLGDQKRDAMRAVCLKRAWRSKESMDLACFDVNVDVYVEKSVERWSVERE